MKIISKDPIFGNFTFIFTFTLILILNCKLLTAKVNLPIKNCNATTAQLSENDFFIWLIQIFTGVAKSKYLICLFHYIGYAFYHICLFPCMPFSIYAFSHICLFPSLFLWIKIHFKSQMFQFGKVRNYSFSNSSKHRFDTN